MAFKDNTGDVLRGVILAMSLYVPAGEGTSKADLSSAQTVVFAFVFVAVRMSWALVVKSIANRIPFHCCQFTRSRLPARQMLYESSHIPVDGFPQAAVVDDTYFAYVHRGLRRQARRAFQAGPEHHDSGGCRPSDESRRACYE